LKSHERTTEALAAGSTYWRQLAAAVGLLSLEPFDRSTPEGRSAERYRRIAWSTVLGIVGRLVGVAVTLVTVPLLLSFLGGERYGLWLTLTSIIAMLGPLDLGIGSGLTTLISSADGRADRNEIRRLVSTAVALSVGAAIVLGFLLALAYPIIPWAVLSNVTSPGAVAEAGPAAAALAACFAFGIPLGLVARIHHGLQEGYIANAWSVVGNLLALALLLVALNWGSGLPILVLAVAGGPLLAATLNGAALFLRQRPWLRPKLRSVDRHQARALLGTGGLFVLLQLSLVVGYQSDAIVIAQLLGAKAVPEYAVPMKLFLVVPTLLSFALTPLWPAYSEALMRRDVPWIARTMRRSILLALALNIPAALLLLAAAPAILTFWVGSAISPPPVLLVSLAIWAVLNSLIGPLSMLLIGLNAIRFAAITGVMMAIANIAISIALVSRIGVAGAIIGTIVAQVAFILLPGWAHARRLLKDAARSPSAPALSPRA